MCFAASLCHHSIVGIYFSLPAGKDFTMSSLLCSKVELLQRNMLLSEKTDVKISERRKICDLFPFSDFPSNSLQTCPSTEVGLNSETFWHCYLFNTKEIKMNQILIHLSITAAEVLLQN